VRRTVSQYSVVQCRPTAYNKQPRTNIGSSSSSSSSNTQPLSPLLLLLLIRGHCSGRRSTSLEYTTDWPASVRPMTTATARLPATRLAGWLFMAQTPLIGVPVMVHFGGGQDQICPNFRQSPLRPRSSAVCARIEYMLWCTCSPRGDATVTGKMVRDTSDLGKMGEVANY